LRGEAEALASPWTATDLPPLHDATSMGTRLYSPIVYVTSRSLGLCSHAIDASEAAAWMTIAGPQSGNCIAACAAARDPLFVIYENGSEQTLYVDPLPWARIGPVRPQLRAMAGWNTKLFAIGADHRLYCREAAPIDLAWLPIGDGPDGRALCLTAYFDR